jgi:hypothetical protein
MDFFTRQKLAVVGGTVVLKSRFVSTKIVSNFEFPSYFNLSARFHVTVTSGYLNRYCGSTSM